MRIKKGISLVVGMITFSGLALAEGIYVEGDVKATPLPSGNTWSTTNSVFVGDEANGLIRLSTGQQWNLTSDVYRSSLGESSNVTGTVEINGGTWTCGQQIHCGYNGIGHVLVDSSGVWSVGADAVYFGRSSSASGSLDLKNGSWNSGTFGVYVGHEGRAEITVGSNGTWTSQSPVALGYEESGSGDVTLNGGRWNVSSGTVYVGHDGSGMVTVKSGGAWNAAGREIHLGEFTNSTGIVTITNSSTFAAREMILGRYGQGDMTISGNSSFSVGNLYMGYYASGGADLVVSNQSHVAIATNLLVGVYGPGALTVTGNSLLETKLTGIGSFEGDGRLYILDNSSWISHGETFIGDGRGISSVTIDHSDWIIENNVIFSGLFGNFIFLEEGNLSSPTHASIQMNWLDNITGSGTISNLTISGGQIEVGPSIYSWGTGSLTLQNVSFVSTNRTDLELTVWADGSCDQLVFDDSVDFSGVDIVIEFADDIAPSNGMEFALFNYTGTGSSPLKVDNVTAPDGWALDPSGVFAERICKITSVAVDGESQAAQLNFCVNPSGGDWILQSTTSLLQPDWQNVHELTKCGRSNLLSAAATGDRQYWRMVEKEKENSDYMVIDLSGGPSASSYPVSYLTAVPPGGWTDEYKTTKLVMRKIPAGTFVMGERASDFPDARDYGLHTVTLTKDFYIGVFEVTQRQWQLVMGNRPSYFNYSSYYASLPVEQVSYYDIRENPANSPISPNWPVSAQVHADSFIGKLRVKTGLSTFDLPTESQWEYACRAGTTTALNSGYNLTSAYGDPQMSAVGRYDSGSTAKAGSYLPNAWGLYDMHGNVWEWTLDKYGTYPGTVSDPSGAESGNRVVRGGSWNFNAYYCRSAHRYYNFSQPYVRARSFGLRVARTLP